MKTDITHAIKAMANISPAYTQHMQLYVDDKHIRITSGDNTGATITHINSGQYFREKPITIKIKKILEFIESKLLPQDRLSKQIKIKDIQNLSFVSISEDTLTITVKLKNQPIEKIISIPLNELEITDGYKLKFSSLPSKDILKVNFPSITDLIKILNVFYNSGDVIKFVKEDNDLYMILPLNLKPDLFLKLKISTYTYSNEETQVYHDKVPIIISVSKFISYLKSLKQAGIKKSVILTFHRLAEKENEPWLITTNMPDGTLAMVITLIYKNTSNSQEDTYIEMSYSKFFKPLYALPRLYELYHKYHNEYFVSELVKMYLNYIWSNWLKFQHIVNDHYRKLIIEYLYEGLINHGLTITSEGEWIINNYKVIPSFQNPNIATLIQKGIFTENDIIKGRVVMNNQIEDIAFITKIIKPAQTKPIKYYNVETQDYVIVYPFHGIWLIFQPIA